MDSLLKMSNLMELRKEQLSLVDKFVPDDKKRIDEIKLVAGVDSAFFQKKKQEYSVCVIAVLNFETLELIEEKYSVIRTDFPYLPTFLSRREFPGFEKTFKKLETLPDAFLFDANGILHPFEMGLATYSGIKCNLMSIGVAKGLLCGRIKGRYVFMGEKKVGFVLRRSGFKDIFISQGNNISLQTAVNIVKRCLRGKFRLPEPLRIADAHSKNFVKKSVNKELC